MELLIKIKSCHCDDKRLDAGRLHAGDVIVAKPDGWQWSRREIEHPDWVLVRVPITQAEAASLTGGELDPRGWKPFTYKRQRTLDLEALKIKATNRLIVLDDKSLVGVTKHKGVASAN